MASPQPIRIPEIFILWHPKCPLGDQLARRIFAWLRPGKGLGPEVFYRSLPAPGSPVGGLPPALPGESREQTPAFTKNRLRISNMQVVLPLIDENMVADPAWRHWLGDIATPSSLRVTLPVALDATAYNMPGPLREMNYLRPAGPQTQAAASAAAQISEDGVRSRLKQITEAMCRLMLPRHTSSMADATASGSSDPLPKVNIFLSHAKQDGMLPARRLRDYIYSQTQLAAFYDENDIAFGALFSRVIQTGLDSSDTAALIAVRSALFAGRPWCRRELSLFRRPRQDSTSVPGQERWRLFPTLVVDAMDGMQYSSGIPELGNSPMIRWSDDGINLEELIVTSVIRDAMLASFHSALGASIPLVGNQIVINWLPDPTTLLHIPALRNGQEFDVFYPGRGLSGLELDILQDYFPMVTFKCFEDKLS
jgi:hypothetical protein